jgi:hypothetical protein
LGAKEVSDRIEKCSYKGVLACFGKKSMESEIGLYEFFRVIL